jgi:glycosyltransferase involved in cell wall biosynthesis
MKNFNFENKVVYIISPERWGPMRVSKHHYALELANRNCKVFFVDPPLLTHSGIQVVDCPDHANIKLVKYKPVYRGKRFLPKWAYNFLLKQQVNTIIKAAGVRPDVVWSFHGYLFEDLRYFKAPTTIFFAADQFNYDYLPGETYSSDISLAVSDTIFNRLIKSDRKVYHINHGLQQVFADAAEKRLKELDNIGRGKDKITVGYVGNIRLDALDRDRIMEVVRENPDLKFIFWGSYKVNDLNLGGKLNAECDDFISFLEQAQNVELRGVLTGNELQKQMEEADMFWMCAKVGFYAFWDSSNSHKILEYFSTGKPVVANYISSYKDTNLIYMLPNSDNENYLSHFKNIVSLVRKGEQPERIAERLKMATANSYKNRLKQIENLINQ